MNRKYTSDKHGWFEIDICNRVVILKCHSTWNKKTAEEMCEQFKSKAASLKESPWACLIDLSDWQLAGEEVAEPVFTLNKWCNENNQSLEAVVCKFEVQKYVIEHVQTPLMDSSIAFFDEFAQATAWLGENGFDVSL